MWQSQKRYSGVWSAQNGNEVIDITLECKDEATAEALSKFLNEHVTGWEVEVCITDKEAAKAEA